MYADIVMSCSFRNYKSKDIPHTLYRPYKCSAIQNFRHEMDVHIYLQLMKCILRTGMFPYSLNNFRIQNKIVVFIFSKYPLVALFSRVTLHGIQVSFHINQTNELTGGSKIHQT